MPAHPHPPPNDLQAVERIEEFVPQALSNMVWACATLRHTHPQYLQAAAQASLAELSQFRSQTLSNMLWGYSSLSIYPKELFQLAAQELVLR
jgi:hypothetical protein